MFSNCLQCRFFITSPVYLGGLIGLLNEISLAAYSVKEKLGELGDAYERIDKQIYDASKAGTNDNELSLKLKKIETQIEAEDHKITMLVSDSVNCMRLIDDCIKLINKQPEESDGTKLPVLLNSENFVLSAELEEVSEFRHLSEVCQFAEVYISGNASSAIARRSQYLDRLLKENQFEPFFYELDKPQQQKIGNQMINLMKMRLEGKGYISNAEKWALIEDSTRNSRLLDTFDSSELILLSEELKYLSENKRMPDSALEINRSDS